MNVPKEIRWSYFANKERSYNFALTSAVTLDLKNCNVDLKPTSESKIWADVSTKYDTFPSLSGNTLVVHNDVGDDNFAAVKCQVDLYLPQASTGVTLPSFSMKSVGDNNKKLRLRDHVTTSYFDFGTSQFSVTGDLINIYLTQEYRLGIMNISIKIGHIEIDKLRPTTSASIITNQGPISIGVPTSVASVGLTSIKETNGQVCLYGGATSSITATNCPNAATRLTTIPYNRGVVSTATQCAITGTLCPNSTCTGTISAYTLTARSDDGTVQVKSDSSIAKVDYQRSSIQPGVNSQTILQRLQELLTSSPKEDHLFIIDVFMPGYAGVWMYTNKKAYLVYKPWSLSFVSGILLKPQTQRVSVYLSDLSCPMRALTSLELQYEINSILQSYFTKSDTTVLTFHNDEDQYLVYDRDKHGSVSATSLSILDEWFYLTAFIISGLIGVLGAMATIWVIYKGFKVLDLEYALYLDRQRSYAMAKKYEDELKKNKGVQSLSGPVSQDKQVIFHLNLFRARKIEYPISQAVEVKKSSLSRFGFFSLISIFIDYQRRIRLSSLISFLDKIPPSVIHFPRTPYQKHSTRFKTTLDVDLFKRKYQEFCIKYGFVPEILEENEDKLEEYGINLEHIMDQTTLAYQFIRWKRETEKDDIEQDLEVFQIDNPINLFLRRECVNTSFQSDYILQSEMTQRYNQFCFNMGVNESQIDKIIGSQELQDFGAVQSDNMQISVLNNIAEGDLGLLQLHVGNIHDKYEDFETGFVRQQQAKDVKKKNYWCWRKLKRFYRWLWVTEGPVNCALQVGVYLLIVVLMVAPLNALVMFFYGERSQFQSDVYSSYYDIRNQLEPDKQDYVLYQTTYAEVIIAVFAYSAFFYIVCLIELLSYFIVGFLNTGKYQVKRSWPKRIVTYTFWTCLMFNGFIYLSYAILYLVWYILAAIINPNKYLPFACGSLTFIYFIYTKRKQIVKFEDELLQRVQEIVQDKIKEYLISSLEMVTGVKQEKLTGEFFIGDIEKNSREVFIRSLVGFLGLNVNNMDQELIQKMINGDQEAYTQVISDAIGIHPSITRTIISILKESNEEILNNIENLANEYKIDPKLSRAISEVCLEKYNPDLFGIKQPDGSTILAVKKLLRYLFPQFEPELVEGILSIVTEGDPRIFIDKINSMNENFEQNNYDEFKEMEVDQLIPTQMFSLLKGYLFENSTKMNDYINKLGREFLKGQTELQSLFDTLFNLSRGDIKTASSRLTELAQIQPKFLIPSIIAFMRNNTDLTREITPVILENIQELKQQELSRKESSPKKRSAEVNNTTIIEEEEKGLDDSIQKEYDEIAGVSSIMDTKQQIDFEQSSMIKKIEDKKVYDDVFLEEDDEFGTDDDDVDIGLQGARTEAGVEENCLALINLNTGNRVKIGNILKNITGDIDKDMLESFHKISRGSIPDFTILLDKLLIFHSKSVIIELFRYIIGQENSLNELSSVLELKPGNEMTLSALVKLFEVGLEANEPSLSDQINEINFRESVTVLVLNNIIDDITNKQQVGREQIKIGQEIEINQLEDFYQKEYQKLMDKQGDGKLERNYDLILDVFDNKIGEILNKRQGNTIKSLAIIIYCMRIEISASDEVYDKALRLVSEVFQVPKLNLQFLLDVISGNPFKLFQCKTTLKEVIEGFEPNYSLQRVIKMKDILNAESTQIVDEVANKWIYAYTQIQRGEMASHNLTKKILHLPNQFVDLLREVRVQYLNPSVKQDKLYQNLVIKKFFLQFQDTFKEILLDGQDIKSEVSIIDDDPRFEVDLNLIQTPFSKFGPKIQKVEEEYVMEGVMEVIIMLVNLKIGDEDEFKNVGIKLAKTFSFIVNYFKTYSSADFLRIVIRLSKRIKISPRANNTLFGTAKDEYLALQFILLGCAKFLDNQCRVDDVTKPSEFQAIVEELITIVNNGIDAEIKVLKSRGLKQIYYNEQISKDNFIESLFEIGFFNHIARTLIAKPLGKIFNQEIERPEALLGLFLGLSIECMSLTRSALIEFIGDTIKPDIINGIIGILQNDLEAEKEIKWLAKKLGLNPKLLIKLIDLTNSESQGVKSIVKTITNDLCENQKVIAGLISLMKKDISQVKYIARQMSIDSDLLMAIMSLTVGNIEHAQPYFSQFSKVFSMGGASNVDLVLKLCLGDTEAVYDLSDISTGYLKMSKPELAEAMVFLTYEGREIMEMVKRKVKKKDKIAKLERATHTIMKQIKESVKTDQSKLYQTKVKKIKLTLEEFIQLLISSIWGDEDSVNTLVNHIIPSTIKNKLSIWNIPQSEKRRVEIFKRKSKNLFFANKRVNQKMQNSSNNKVKAFRETHLKLLHVKQSKFDEKLAETKSKLDEKQLIIMESQIENFEQLPDLESPYLNYLYNVGCTFNITSNAIKMKYYMCLTCSGDLNLNNGICGVCAKFCHAGHDLVKGNYGQETNIICDCGSGWYSNPLNTQFNEENPLRKCGEFQDKDEEFWTECQMNGTMKNNRKDYWYDAVVKAKTDDQWLNEKDDTKSKKSSHTKVEDKNEVEDEKSFDQILSEYTVTDFLYDIELLFPLPKTKTNIKSEYLQQYKTTTAITSQLSEGYKKIETLSFYDYRQNRDITFFEQVMYLAMGQGKASFIAFLASGEKFEKRHARASDFRSNPSYFMELDNFASCVTLMSLIQGDNRNLHMYSGALCDELEIDGTKEFSREDKLYSMHLLTKGSKLNQHDKFKKETKPNPVGMYERTFYRLFQVHFRKALVLHKFISTPDEDIIRLMKQSQEQLKTAKNKELDNIKLYIENELFPIYLQLDPNSIKWSKSLIRISLGDINAFDNVAKDLKINNQKAALYKSFSSMELSKVSTVLNALSSIIPRSFAEIIYNLSNGDNEAIIMLVIGKYLLQQGQNKQMNWDNLNYDTMSVPDRLKLVKYLKALIEVIDGDDFNLQTNLKYILKEIKWDNEIRYALESMQGILKEDYKAILQLNNLSGNKAKSDLPKKHLLSLFTYQWEKKDILGIIDLVVPYVDDTKYTSRSEVIKREIKSQFKSNSGLMFVTRLFKALEGDIVSIGVVFDTIAFQNTSCLFTMLTNFYYGGSLVAEVPESETKLETEEAYRQLYKREIYRLVWRILPCNKDLYDPQTYLDFLYDHHIPELLIMATSMNFKFISTIMDPIEIMSTYKGKETVDPNLIITLMNFVKPNSIVPDLKPIFQQVFKVSANKDNLFDGAQDTAEGVYNSVIKIMNFPSKFNIKLDNAKKLLEDKNEEEVKAKKDSNDPMFKYYKGLTRDFCKQINFTVEEDGVYIDIVKGFKILFDCKANQKKSILTLIHTFLPLYREIQLYPELLRAFKLIAEKRKQKVFVFLPHIILITLMSIKVSTKQSLNIEDFLVDVGETEKNAVSEREVMMVEALVQCFKVIVLMLRKDKIMDAEASMAAMIEKMLTLTLAYHKKVDYKSGLVQSEETLTRMSLVLSGLISMCKQDFDEISAMATQIGGFSQTKIVKLIQFIRKYLKMFNKQQIQGEGNYEEPNEPVINKQIIDSIIGDKLDMIDMFNMFDTDGSGQIDFNEFIELCKYIGVSLGEHKMLQLFSKVDQNHDNLMSYDEFTKAMVFLRLMIAQETLDKLGLSHADIIGAFMVSVMFLILLLSFIFIGIMALASSDSFSAVINSLLPILAGLGVSSQDLNLDKVKEKLTDTVIVLLDSMKQNI